MREPLAYLLTWTSYATWLHGDRRGSVDSAHARFGTPVIEPSDRLVERDRGSATGRCVLNAEARGVVTRAIEDDAAYRGVQILALNVRSNHVHVVVQARGRAPEVIMTQFKSWSTRRLREAGLVDESQKVWTRHGSTRYLWGDEHVRGAVHYVLHEQGPALALGPLTEEAW